MQLQRAALSLAVLPTVLAAVVTNCLLDCHECDRPQAIVQICVDPGNGLRGWANIQVCSKAICRSQYGCDVYCDDSAAPATTLVSVGTDCRLGANKCDNANTSVMVCGAQGWKVTEICSSDNTCHTGPAGNAYCDKAIECTTGNSQCDTANYASKICNNNGFWQTDRKCSKPGCCTVKEGRAVCKAECGPGQQPPAELANSSVTRDLSKPGDRCTPVGEGYCDAAHKCTLRCGNNQVLRK